MIVCLDGYIKKTIDTFSNKSLFPKMPTVRFSPADSVCRKCGMDRKDLPGEITALFMNHAFKPTDCNRLKSTNRLAEKQPQQPDATA